MKENKTQPTNVSAASFIAALADERRRQDAEKMAALMERITGEKPKMWGPSIIGFGSHHYAYESGRTGEMPLAGFSPRKAGLVVYGMGSFGEGDALRLQLGKHTMGGGCLYIKKLADVEERVLEEMIAKSVAARRSAGG